MENIVTKALVRTILQHAENLPWRMQSIGLMSLRLGDSLENVLHVWDQSDTVLEHPIHDHPFEFTSSIIVGEMINTRYEENPAGTEYFRFRYTLGNEENRQADKVRLVGKARVYLEGEEYRQNAHELHDSRQLPGTVTLIRRHFLDITQLTVCLSRRDSWLSGKARPATKEEIKKISSKALKWF